MDETFGKYSEYMAIGYAAMGVILVAMIVWMYLRYVGLRREQEQIAQLERELAEERGDRVAQAAGAREEQARPRDATEGVSGMAAPDSERSRAMPE